eukprot:CAMPEP_0113660980 /NCGR_PEP_ID=MMETSP0017_2-20120614/33189_1 /TAXON_ID=2856 /ORGANISM="Cylindrotheca closterium" /LENGTH=229 /DNA_ID=CAMNT_0000575651 /DNA_START=39 /DNA_END=729 /DNA_ORIENTATION=+ /assembly_acc=CAM_ASM_000147
MKSYTTFQYLLCATLATSLLSEAFTLTPSRGIAISNAPTIAATALSAKKKSRRKRKEPKEDLPDFELDGDDGALPDFDLGEEDAPVKPAAKKPTETTDFPLNATPAASLDDLIADRKLESKFVFDESVEDKSIPDFVDFAGPSDSAPPAPGSKAERRAQRKAAAIARVEAEKESTFDIPFITDESGKISGLKILEAGAWAGIFLLIGWEVYINSPFFDRAGPMAPVVFE